MADHWDKTLTRKLVEAGLSWEHARIAVGEIAEQRQLADHEGYVRGYNSGYEEGKKWKPVKEHAGPTRE